MRPETQHILEKRRLRRRVTLWRAIAVIAVIGVVLVLLPRPASGPDLHVARISIEGVIVEDRERDQFLQRLANDDQVTAVIVHISSPGGSVVGSEALYDGLRAISAKKPVVAVMGDVAASGGYIAALGTDHIIARGGTLTGSIGVITIIPNVEGLLDMAGIEVKLVRSSPLKGEPTITGPLSPESEAALREILDDAYVWFRDLVADRRALEGEKLAEVADGRAFSGRQALELGLIDQLGDERTALAYLAENGIDSKVRVRDRDWKSQLPWPLEMGGQIGALLFGEAAPLPASPRLWAIMH